MGFNSSIALIHEWHIDLGVEVDIRWDLWVILSALDCQEVNTIVIVGVWWPNDGSIPVSEGFVVA